VPVGDVRVWIDVPVATSTCDHVVARDITQYHRGGAAVEARQALQTCAQLQAVHQAERRRLLAEFSTRGRRNANSHDPANAKDG
jgi:hypothetical protein